MEGEEVVVWMTVGDLLLKLMWLMGGREIVARLVGSEADAVCAEGKQSKEKEKMSKKRKIEKGVSISANKHEKANAFRVKH